MDQQSRVLCPENEELAKYFVQKRQELAEKPKGIPENTDNTLSKAYYNICNAQHPIKTLKELNAIKGVGKWILSLMKGYFESTQSSSGSSQAEDSTKNDKRTKGKRRYLPQRNSVAYALLITLYRGTADENEFMRKQDLIDAAEASGLSRAPIMPEKGKGKPSQVGSSPRDWYTGWSCMSTLINKGLVAKWSNPAKYKLTEAGKEVARECMLRSNLANSRTNLTNLGASDLHRDDVLDLGCAQPDTCREETISSAGFSQKSSVDVPVELLERFMPMGYSKEQVLHAFSEVSETSQDREFSSLWPAVMCHLREDRVYGGENPASNHSDLVDLTCDGGHNPGFSSLPSLFTLRACSLTDCIAEKSITNGLEASMNVLSLPPLSLGERFEDIYEVILILDDREQFSNQRSRNRRVVESICSDFKIKTEFRRLPIGDGIWIVRHKVLHSEYVLDFIVERKNIDDLRSSIRDNRYKDQKLRLLRSGLKKPIYLVEGDPNRSEVAESIKTACFTTEILEGFDVQRTINLPDTIKKYSHLTRAITHYYKSYLPEDPSRCPGVCPLYNEFIKRCQELDKITVSDVFAIQLMQVPQVTEDIALAVVDMYPTLLSLARAYSLLDGDVGAQEEMLKKLSNNVVSSAASKNIFKFVWGD
ncbi:hypothetical protein SLEP1_g5983 [Rubroshorea leprosula]|uniref:Crossover junction endonuclease MUS81 n=1 Tax=Rubroshorea leprosula TaxID=152421 RepID=A0AAV5I3K0_9ROSI|nr:hypothetical protein SLEP1_g5983 [Rubroshorea leprosula]